ncbi:MAG: DUF2480 family protein [Saprospiraceae bacterium]
MSDLLVNRVASSGLITFKLEDFFPKEELLEFDLKPFLFMELILKEKDFREAMKSHDWVQYTGKNLIVYCSVDAIIPVWAYMLVAVHAAPFANEIFQGDTENFIKAHFEKIIDTLDIGHFMNQRVVIKGCSDKPVPPSAYLALTRKLQPVVQSIMYGEPCSTVPIYKKSKEN